MNFIENLVVKVSSDRISLTSVVKENSDTLKMLNANVNRIMKHVVDNETTKSNKHMIDTCTTTYVAHPLKSSEKKESSMQFKNADEMLVDRRPNIMKRQCLSMVVDSSTPRKTTMISPKIQIPFAKGLEFDMGGPRNPKLLTLHNSSIVDQHPLQSMFKCHSHRGGNQSEVTTSTPYLCSKWMRRILAEHNFSKDDMRSANELRKSLMSTIADNITRQVVEQVKKAMEVVGSAQPVPDGEPSHRSEGRSTFRLMEHGKDAVQSETSDRLPRERQGGCAAEEHVTRSAQGKIIVSATASTP
ncbi:hypothetical protein Cgig2_034187 [Carnegiea gigantea]|uniref:Uncharacterized protein n=1 Tax=Carnegiea gigantea TaxID=171969 RepID=A0A9Q1GSN0_9CARY|nr:hypothetical protein Cgig2_034187 [Carnegiea gigantea]